MWLLDLNTIMALSRADTRDFTVDASVFSRPFSSPYLRSVFSTIFFPSSENGNDFPLLILCFLIVFIRLFIATRSQRRPWPRRHRRVHRNTRTSGTRFFNTGSYCVYVILFSYYCRRKLLCKQ